MTQDLFYSSDILPSLSKLQLEWDSCFPFLINVRKVTITRKLLGIHLIPNFHLATTFQNIF